MTFEPSLPNSLNQSMVPFLIFLFKCNKYNLIRTAQQIEAAINPQLLENAITYLGALDSGYRYAFQIDVELQTQFMTDKAIALFNGGLGTDDDIHEIIIV